MALFLSPFVFLLFSPPATPSSNGTLGSNPEIEHKILEWKDQRNRKIKREIRQRSVHEMGEREKERDVRGKIDGHPIQVPAGHPADRKAILFKRPETDRGW